VDASSIVLLVVGVLALGGVAVLVALYLAIRLAARPDRAPVRPTAADELDHYFRRRAGFAVTVNASTALAVDDVFARLVGRPYLSSLPFVSGPHWASEARGIGAERTMSGTVFSVAEVVVVDDPGRELALAGTAVCVPWTIRDFAERFEVVDRGDSRLVEWTIAGTPRWVGWLPWRLLAPVARPVFAFVLRHVLRPRTFRSM